MKSQVVVLSCLAFLSCQSRAEERQSLRKIYQKRSELIALARGNAPDATDKLLPSLGTGNDDIALWGLGRLGPQAAVAIKDIESSQIRRSHLRNANYRSAEEAIERIMGCPSGQDSVSKNRFVEIEAQQRARVDVIGYQGFMSSISSRSVTIANNSATWQKLWGANGSHPSCRPEVDFSREIVIAIFIGNTTWTEFANLVKIDYDAKETRVYYDDLLSDGISDAPSSPYIFIRLPKPIVPLHVIETKLYAMSSEKPQIQVMASYIPEAR